MFTKIRMGLVALIVAFSLIQLIFFPDLVNSICVLIASSTSIVTVQTMLKRDLLQRYTITCLQVLLFALANLALPIVATTLELHPLVFNLSVPIQTFSLIALLAFVLLFSHWLYRGLPILQKLRTTTTRRIHMPLGLFTTPSDMQLWLMGLVGFLATFYVTVFLPDAGQSGTGGLTEKILQGLISFAYAPFLIPLSFLYSEQRRVDISQKFALIVYSLMLIGLGLLRNSRATFALLVFALVMAVLVGLLTYRLPLSSLKSKNVFVFLVVGCVGLYFLPDLATAMVVARVQRGSVSSIELAETTLDVFLDKDRLNSYAEDKAVIGNGQWNEYYIADPFLSRIISVKFHDNIFNLVNQEDAGAKEYLKDVTVQKTLALLPTPFLSLSSANVDKEFVIQSSIGDYIWYIQSGRGLAGKRVGSFIGHGTALFGDLFFLLVIPVCLCMFPFMDSLSYNEIRSRGLSSSEVHGGQKRVEFFNPTFSIVCLLQLSLILTYLSMESVIGYIEFFIRAFPQMVLLYALVFWLTGFTKIGMARSRQRASGTATVH